MPKIKIDHIISFSSEDPVCVANNILNTDSNKKWKCQFPGEKQAIVVLQLEKASQITTIDIGNEHSAYVEVLVSRSSNNDDFKVLLANSAFMSALEARQSQNVNKVRMFTIDQLSKPECEEKWDRVKIICSQPFNRHVQFGLSFITLHSNEIKPESHKTHNLGKFSIRPESPNISIGSLFAKQKETKPTAAAAIRDASSRSSLALYTPPTYNAKLENKYSNFTPNLNQTSNSIESIPKDRNRDALFYLEDEKNEGDVEKVTKKIEEIPLNKEINKTKRKNIHTEDMTKNHKKKKIHVNDDETKIQGDRNRLPNEDKRSHEVNIKNTTIKKNDKNNINSKKMKPFHELLQGVVIVISGIQNPDRTNLRTMALSMGAKYKPDWDESCTHLICAFPNTPKFNQVKGKGKIVKKSWIEMSFKERKKLPWRRFSLDKSDLDQSESEDEIYESKQESPENNKCEADGSDTEERIATILRKKKEETLENRVKKNLFSDTNIVDNGHDRSSYEYKNVTLKTCNKDEEKPKGKKQKFAIMDVSHTDADSSCKITNEESPNSLSRNNDELVSLTISNNAKIDAYEADTDEEQRPLNSFKNGRLLDFFHGEKFYVDKNLDKKTYKMLCKFIVAYNGNYVYKIADDIDIVTTKENSKKIKESNPKAKCVDQEWILKIHRKRKLVPRKNFVL